MIEKTGIIGGLDLTEKAEHSRRRASSLAQAHHVLSMFVKAFVSCSQHDRTNVRQTQGSQYSASLGGVTKQRKYYQLK